MLIILSEQQKIVRLLRLTQSNTKFMSIDGALSSGTKWIIFACSNGRMHISHFFRIINISCLNFTIRIVLFVNFHLKIISIKTHSNWRSFSHPNVWNKLMVWVPCTIFMMNRPFNWYIWMTKWFAIRIIFDMDDLQK